MNWEMRVFKKKFFTGIQSGNHQKIWDCLRCLREGYFKHKSHLPRAFSSCRISWRISAIHVCLVFSRNNNAPYIRRFNFALVLCRMVGYLPKEYFNQRYYKIFTYIFAISRTWFIAKLQLVLHDIKLWSMFAL